MKLAVCCAISLLLACCLTTAIGYAPSASRWGSDGTDSLLAVGVICLCSSLLALAPLGFVAPRYPEYIGQAGLAATVLRLMLTMGALVAYQVLMTPHLQSFLFWAPIFYLLLLAIETGFGVAMVKKYYRVPPQQDGAAS